MTMKIKQINILLKAKCVYITKLEYMEPLYKISVPFSSIQLC